MDKQQKQEAKYYTKSMMGLFNDKVEVGMSKLRGEESVAFDVAIIKATLQDEVVPKEKHVRTLKIACGASAPRQQVRSDMPRRRVHGCSPVAAGHHAWWHSHRMVPQRQLCGFVCRLMRACHLGCCHHMPRAMHEWWCHGTVLTD